MDLGLHFTGRLPLNGRVRLLIGDREVKLRRRALALLYLLGLEGPTPREELALLVWGRKSARQNLRVELHYLNQRLADAGLPPLEKRGDRLALPAALGIDEGAGLGLLLSGLEGLSPGLDAWIRERRRRAGEAPGEPLEGPRVPAGLAEGVRPPFLLLVEAGPLFDFRGFARELAKRLGLPLLGPGAGDRAGVHLLSERPGGADLEAALEAERAVWVVPVNALGEEGRHVLRLRAQWPPERVRYLRPDRLGWAECKRRFPKRALEELAEAFLEAGGEASVLAEGLAERGGPGQRVRAAYQAEARHLSQPARLFVETLAPYPGVLPDEAVAALGGEPLLDELERKRWLAYRRGWFIAPEVARRALVRSLQPGRRQRALRRLRAAFEAGEHPLAAAFLERELGRPLPAEPPGALAPWARAVWQGGAGQAPADLPEVRLGGELLLEPPECSGCAGDAEGLKATGFGPPYRFRRAAFPPLEEAAWYVLEGEVFAQNLLGIGANGDRLPLAVRAGGETLLALARVPALLRTNGAVVAPLGRFAYAVRLPAGVGLSLVFGFERGVASVRVRARRAEGGDGPRRLGLPA